MGDPDLKFYCIKGYSRVITLVQHVFCMRDIKVFTAGGISDVGVPDLTIYCMRMLNEDLKQEIIMIQILGNELSVKEKKKRMN